MATVMEFDTELIRELTGYETRLKDAAGPIKHKRRLAHDKVHAASARGVLDVPAAVDCAFAEITTDADLTDIRAGQYTVKKLVAAARAGVLDAEWDGELRQLRRLMRRLRR